MSFKTYDIFSALIPGYLLLFFFIKFYNIPYDNDLVLCYTAGAYLIGFLANSLASWLEPVYFLTWGGKPSNQLLSGKSFLKIRIYDISKVRSFILLQIKKEDAEYDELFSYAKRQTLGEKDTRIEDFNMIYAFSRTILTTFLIIVVIVAIGNNDFPGWVYIAVIFCLIITWFRAKERGFYYAKEVLEVFAKKMNVSE